jgi:hypothetical protein
MVMSPAGLGPENDCAGEDQQKIRINDRLVLSSERAPTSTNPQLSYSNKSLVVSPRCVLDTKTDWPTGCR